MTKAPLAVPLSGARALPATPSEKTGRHAPWKYLTLTRSLGVAAAAVALLAPACGGDGDETPAVPLGRFVAATRSMTPSAHLFGDTVSARVDVIVDRDRLDPDRVRLQAAFPPYERVGKISVERRDHDRYTRLRFDLRLRCLGIACLAPGVSPGVTPAGGTPAARRAERVFRFNPAHVYYDDPRTGKPRHLKRIWWPRLESLTRISPSEPGLTFALRTPFRTTISSLPGLTYRISPALLGTALLLAAAIVLVLPARSAWSWLRSRRPPPVVEEARELTPLERAIMLVEQARESVDGEDRRKALEVLAVELEASGLAEQAERARRLAWSPAAPSPEAAETLVESVREPNAA